LKESSAVCFCNLIAFDIKLQQIYMHRNADADSHLRVTHQSRDAQRNQQMRISTPPYTAVVLSTLVSAAVVVACSDDTGNTPPAPGATATASPTSTSTPPLAPTTVPTTAPTTVPTTAPTTAPTTTPTMMPTISPTAPPPPPPVLSSQGRLLVNDANPENPRVRVFDLDDAKIVEEMPMLGTPALYSTEASSGFGYVNQRVQNVVEIVASGISIDPITKSVKKQPPAILDERFVGLLPTHWVTHDRWIVSFNDGDGSFDYLLESTLGTGRVLRHKATTGRKHHGVAVIASGNVFASLPDANDPNAALPVGVTQRRLATPDTVVRQSADCPLLHGEGGSDTTVAFGCGDGVLIAERTGGDFAFRKLPNPADTPAGRRVGTVRMAEGLARIVGNWGNGFVVINPTVSPATWSAVDIGGLNLGFRVDEASKRIYALSGDGTLRAYDGLTGAPIGVPLAVIDAWAPPAGQSPPRPSLTLGHDRAFVPDPRKGEVVEVDLKTWTKVRTLNVGGQPTSVAPIGFTVVR
jgi:hypothetical protein